MWFNNFSDAVIEYRRTRFEAYLTLLVRPVPHIWFVWICVTYITSQSIT